MKRLSILVFTAVFALLVGCGDNHTSQASIQNAKEHMSDATDDVQEAGKDVQKAVQPTVKTIKERTKDTMNKASEKLETLKNKGKLFFKDTKQKAQEMLTPESDQSTEQSMK